MTVMEFFGCTFIAFGPPFALFYFTVSHDPVRIIILIASAFFWLLSLLLSSLWWTIVIPLKDKVEFALVFSVLFQEVFRFLMYLILRKAEGGLKKVTTDANTTLVDNKHILAYVSGLGFGVMSGAFAIINVLADAAGPGTVGIQKGGDSPVFFVTSALTTLCFILLHTSWSVIFFDALDKKNYFLIAVVAAAHFASSFLTLLNRHNYYWASIPSIYVVLIISAWLAFRSAGARFNKAELFQRRPVTLQVTD